MVQADMNLWVGNLLAWGVGAAVTLGAVWASARLPPRAATLPAVVGWLSLLAVAALTLLALLREGWATGGFGAAYLVVGGTAGLLLSLPRLLRWRGAEARWVSLGLGLLTPVGLTLLGLGLDGVLAALLPPERKAQVSFHLTNGLLWGLLPALALTMLWAARGRGRER